MSSLIDTQFRLLINGQIRESDAQKTFDCINPSNNQVFAQCADASLNDVKAAIDAARHAFDNGPWKTLSYAERGIYLKKIAKLIRDNAKELAGLETKDVGKTSKHSNFIDIPTSAETFEYFSQISDELEPTELKIDAPVKSVVVREPIGVVVCIIPWNYPMIMAAWKIAPALIAGNTVVFKPSQKASCSVMRLAQLFAETGIPEGVINFVSTANHSTASELISSDKVDMISFTGGTATGQDLMRKAADTTKKLTLELGGKSPNIVFADAQRDAAIGGALSAIFMNQGQMCTAGSRLLVEASIHDEFVEELVQRAQKISVGDASQATTAFGPVIDMNHRDELLNAIKDAVSKGATLASGGEIPENLDGAYINPTILTNVTNDMTVAQEELFGPVLSVIKFSDEEEAIKLANDSKYGLAASVWTKDEEKSTRVSNALECGTVWVNTYGGFYNEAPYGGYKQSGFGRELGEDGLKEYTQTKHICRDQTPGGMPLAASWF